MIQLIFNLLMESKLITVMTPRISCLMLHDLIASIQMRLTMNFLIKSICSLELSILDTGPMFLILRKNLLNQDSSMYTPGNSMTKHSHSQESDDMNTFKRTWTCLNISKTTLIRTLVTQFIWKISLELQTQLEIIFWLNITMVSLMTQLIMIQKLKMIENKPVIF